MDKTINSLSSNIIGIRSGTITTGFIDTVKISYHGQLTPIKHIAYTAKIGDSIAIDAYEPTLTAQIAKNLADAGFSAYAFSKTRVLVSVPPPSGDQKKETIAHLKKLGEEAKIAIRNIRKSFRQKLDKEELKTADSGIQKTTDSYIKEIDDIINTKIGSL